MRCILFRFLIKGALTAIRFNGRYLYLGRAPAEIITLPLGKHCGNTCFTQADDSAMFPLYRFFLWYYSLPSARVIKKSARGDTDKGAVFLPEGGSDFLIIEFTRRKVKEGKRLKG